MRLLDYLRAVAFDFAICFVAALSLGFANCGAFFVSADLQFNPLALALATAVPLAVLFASAYSRKTVIPGALAVVVVVVAGCALAHALIGEGMMFRDTTANPETFVLVMDLSALVTFLMTRRRWLARLFVLVVVFDLCFVEFMYKQGYWPALLAALVMAGAMAVFRNYRTNLRDASADSISFGAAAGVGAIYALAIVALSCLAFVAIVAPLDPQALEIKLFTRYMTYETVEMTGIGDASATPGAYDTTSRENDLTDQSDQTDDEQGTQDEQSGGLSRPLDLPSIGSMPDLGASGAALLRDLANFLLEEPIRIPLLLLALAVVLIAPVALKKLLRARWFSRTCALEPMACVERLYLFFLKRFGKIDVGKPENLTLQEFAEQANGTLSGFAANEAGIDFKGLTDIYCRGVYGGVAPSSEEVESYKSFYRHFYKAFAAACGRRRYALRFFVV